MSEFDNAAMHGTPAEPRAHTAQTEAADERMSPMARRVLIFRVPGLGYRRSRQHDLLANAATKFRDEFGLSSRRWD